ncbi:MAG: hypothetical protein Q7R47_05805, partial [Candidatus Diapherotrites archaeon]|nr:hypothetical protein [Candidatus Diapherotrites archaeon]
RQNVHLAMLPLEPANDYLFYFYIPLDTSGPSTNPNSQNKFPYFLFWKSEYEIDPSNPNSRFVTINPKGHTAYYCHPAGDRIEIVDNLLFTLTRKSKTTGRSRLPFEQGYRNLESTLVVWPSQSFPDKITDGAADVFAPLNCCPAEDWDQYIKNPDTVPIPATCTANHIFEATAPAP